jgi:hypothetical protein
MVEIYFQCQSDNGTLLESTMSHEMNDSNVISLISK